MRSRTCTNPPPQEGQDCVGCPEEYELCNQKPCVDVSRKVSSWTPWTPAGNGTHKRYRFSCRSQPDQSTINIMQDKEESRLCQDGSCHRLGKLFSMQTLLFVCVIVPLLLCCNNISSRVDQPSDSEDLWSEWSPWSMCSADCGGGVQIKTRVCDGPIDNCEGVAKLSRPCNTHRCKGISSIYICVLIQLILTTNY